MRTGSTIADPPVPVTLQEQEMLRRGRRLAEKIGVRTGLLEAKKAENKKRQEEIDELDEEIAAEARVIIDGFENRAQGDLFVDQALPRDEAAQRLAEIAARALKHPFVASETAIDTCAREGCTAQATAEVHIPPPPSEPHTFVPDGSGEGKCWACGSGTEDTVHAAPVIESENTPSNKASEIATTFVCADCIASGADVAAATHLRAEGWWLDHDMRNVCANCRQTAIEAGRWPHVFRKGHAKAKRCADCNGREDDKVHLLADIPPVEPTAEETQAVAENAAATGDPAFDFTDQEPPPAVIASAKAIETPDEEPIGGEA